MRIAIAIAAILAVSPAASWAGLSLLESRGWLEAASVTWSPMQGAGRYAVYCSRAGAAEFKLDDPLIRSYGSWMRADVVGIPAGSYVLRVVPVVGGVEKTELGSSTAPLQVRAHVREGFAFVDSTGGDVVPGAYKRDGSPKDGAKILYVTASTVNTVTTTVLNEKGAGVSVAGLINILAARGKGYDKTPLIIRMVGTIRASEINGLVSGNYIAFTGANATDRTIANITFEGVGDDATAYGYGFFMKRSQGIEIRNVGIMLFGDDGVSMEGDNHHEWIHNCDFFYGKPGSDADQVKGDGSIDMKYNTTNITISFNHFWETGKSTFAGGAVETNPIFFTYHHNWFDHSDSRHPRICHATVHVYNNFYDGIAGMGLLNTENSSAFVEANRYRHCPYPMMINMQGTNAAIWPDGEQNGGMTKAWNNSMEGVSKLVYQAASATDFDAWLASSRAERIPATVKSRTGGNTYSNFDTDAKMYAYVPDSPDSVEARVTADAGRMGGGDLKWVFQDAVDDTAHGINAALKSAIVGYASGLVSIQGEASTSIARSFGGHVAVVSSGAGIEVRGVSDGPWRYALVDASGRGVAHDATARDGVLRLQGAGAGAGVRWLQLQGPSGGREVRIIPVLGGNSQGRDRVP